MESFCSTNISNDSSIVFNRSLCPCLYNWLMYNKILWISVYILAIVILVFLIIIKVEFTDEKNKRYFDKYNDPYRSSSIISRN